MSDSIPKLVADGELERALEALSAQASLSSSTAADRAILLLSRYRSTQHELDLGVIAAEAAAARFAQLAQAALRMDRAFAETRDSSANALTANQSNARSPNGPDNAGTLRVVGLFLASSVELREDRDALDLYIRQQNDRLRHGGVYIEVIRWETFGHAMSRTRLQDEYNTAVRCSDIFLCLIFTKAGEFTREEFDVAHQSFLETGKPRIYTYFRSVDPNRNLPDAAGLASLRAFQEKLATAGHFYVEYRSTEELLLKFRAQLDQL